MQVSVSSFRNGLNSMVVMVPRRPNWIICLGLMDLFHFSFVWMVIILYGVTISYSTGLLVQVYSRSAVEDFDQGGEDRGQQGI